MNHFLNPLARRAQMRNMKKKTIYFYNYVHPQVALCLLTLAAEANHSLVNPLARRAQKRNKNQIRFILQLRAYGMVTVCLHGC